MNERQDGDFRRPHVVVIGGGTGLSVMLRGLKEQPLDITAIVTVSDDGGSSGRLRSDLQMPPPGDIRNVLVSLARTGPLLEQVLQYRFKNGEGLAGHTLGNLMLAAMKEITGDFHEAIKGMSRVLAVRGQVLPASSQDVVLMAEMTDGTIVQGESQITKTDKKIHRVFLCPPQPKPLEEAIMAIHEADAIVVGPGSLYTSILPNLLVKGMVDAIVTSPALKIFICNVMTQPGETDGYSASDHLDAIYNHIHQHIFDFVIVNEGIPPLGILKQYAKEGSVPVRPDLERLLSYGCELIVDNLLQYRSVLRHDAARLSWHIMRLLRSKERCSTRG